MGMDKAQHLACETYIIRLSELEKRDGLALEPFDTF
jgi:hypothetical protein